MLGVVRRMAGEVELLRRVRRFSRVRDWHWAATLAAARQFSPGAYCDPATGDLVLPDIGLQLRRGRDEHFVSELAGLRELKHQAGVRFSRTAAADTAAADTLVVDTGRFKAFMETAEEICILREVLIGGCYNFADQQPLVVLDIGMNVGLASLYFASKPNVVAVHSFEPFEPTFAQAMRNVSLNPVLGAKIEATNIGLAAADGAIKVPYNYHLKGSTGKTGPWNEMMPSGNGGAGIAFTEAVLRTVDCRPVVDSILQKHAGLPVIAKIDCEGAEYEIVEALSQAGLLNRLTGILMEWHKRGPDPLVSTLTQSGFTCLSMNPNNSFVGLIYAVRRGT